MGRLPNGSDWFGSKQPEYVLGVYTDRKGNCSLLKQAVQHGPRIGISNFASVGGCFIEMNGFVGGSVEMKFSSIGGGSKFKVPSSPRTYVLLE